MGEEPRRFVKLWFARAKLNIMMRPAALEDEVREVISAAEAKKVLKHIETCDSTMSQQWKTRTGRNEKAIASHDPFECARVYKGLSRFQAEGNNLRAADRKHMQTAFELLADELAAALDKPISEIEVDIRKRSEV
ncbi:MAG: hypothetical protein AAGE01_12555 [Pseudomonadota bacterium]